MRCEWSVSSPGYSILSLSVSLSHTLSSMQYWTIQFASSHTNTPSHSTYYDTIHTAYSKLILILSDENIIARIVPYTHIRNDLLRYFPILRISNAWRGRHRCDTLQYTHTHIHAAVAFVFNLNIYFGISAACHLKDLSAGEKKNKNSSLLTEYENGMKCEEEEVKPFSRYFLTSLHGGWRLVWIRMWLMQGLLD